MATLTSELGLASSPVGIPASDQAIRVLAAGDPRFQKSVTSVLDSGDIALVECVDDAKTMLEKINRGFDCIVVDKTVGDRSSLELHETIVQNFYNAPPMILVTAEGKYQAVLKTFRSGLSDYVSMDHDFGAELLHAIRRAVERGGKTRALIEEIEHLSKLANYDRLTGLANRNVLNDRLVSLFATGDRHGVPFAVFLIEINNFKQINAVHGHATGDRRSGLLPASSLSPVARLTRLDGCRATNSCT